MAFVKLHQLRVNLLHKTLLFGAISFFVICILVGTLDNQQYIRLVTVPILFYLFLTLIRRIFFFSGALHDKIMKSKRMEIRLKDIPLPYVSILLPCYNEEKVIEESLRSLLKIEYPQYEIIVIDDGSNDLTAFLATNVSMHSAFVPIRVIQKANGGKASALNEGIKNAKGDLILCCDADSLIDPQSLRQAVPHFLNSNVAAVAGFVEILNTNKMITKFQQLEYQLGLNFLRRGMGVLGIVPIVPGPAGLFRKRAILECGGFHTHRGLFAEDAELSMRLIQRGWEIHSEEDFIAYTEAPEHWRDLYRQRYRWSRGVFQAFRMNVFQILQSRTWRGYVLAAYLVSEIYWIPVINIGLTLMFITHLFIHQSAQLLTLLFAGLIILEMVSAIFASYKLGKPIQWIFVSILSMLSYSQLLMNWKMTALVDEWLDKPMGWDKLDRQGIEKVGQSS